VCRLVLEMGVKLTFVVGLDEDARPERGETSGVGDKLQCINYSSFSWRKYVLGNVLVRIVRRGLQASPLLLPLETIKAGFNIKSPSEFSRINYLQVR